MDGSLGTASLVLTATATLSGVLLTRRRLKRHHEQIGGLERASEVRWNGFLFALIVVPVFVAVVLQVALTLLVRVVEPRRAGRV